MLLKKISISQDATRVITRNPNSNKLAGFVHRVLAFGGSFQAISFDGVEQMFSNASKASSAYIYVARLLSPSTPPFCL